MNKPLVSVNIPVYNGEKTLRQCLNSVLNQTYSNYEVIVVDNNSTDNTNEIIKEFEKKNRKVKYVFEKYLSRGAARNAGIRKARGYIIAMTDADCIVPKNWLEELTKPIIYENETTVMGFEKDLIKNYWTRNIQKADWEFFQRMRSGQHINHIDTKNFAIRASTLKKLMFNSRLAALEEFEFYLRLRRIAIIRLILSLRVGHYHRDSFLKVLSRQFNHGFWVTRIYQNFKKQMSIENEPMIESISLKNFVLFPSWIALQLIKRPVGETYFLLVSELSWRAGIIWAKINNLKFQ